MSSAGRAGGRSRINSQAQTRGAGGSRHEFCREGRRSKPHQQPGADQRRGRSRDMSSAGRAGGRSRINIDPHRLVRRERGRVLAGVAAGVGDTLGVAANVVRCGFLVLTLAGGLGVVLYGVGWLLMRSGDPDLPPPAHRRGLVRVAFSAVVLGLLLLVRVPPGRGRATSSSGRWRRRWSGSRSSRCVRASPRRIVPSGRSSSTCRPRPPTRSACSSVRGAARSRGSSPARCASSPGWPRSS